MKQLDEFDDITAIRPTFEQDSFHSQAAIVQAFQDHLNLNNPSCSGSVHSPYVVLYPHLSDQHYWSPQLSILIEEEQSHRTLHGRFGPKPAVWTMFVFFYAVIGLAAVIIGLIGLANWSLDESTAILYLIPVLIGLFFSLFLVSAAGKKKGHDQMVELQQTFNSIMNEINPA